MESNNAIKNPILCEFLHELILLIATFPRTFKLLRFPVRNVSIKHLLLLGVVILKMQTFSVRYSCFSTQSRRLC